MSSINDVGEARWSAGEVRRVFAQGAAPDLDALAGRWDGRLVGSTWLHTAAAVTAAMSPMRGWCGKRIEASGAAVNLVRRAGTVRDSVPAVAAPGRSLLDGRPAVVVDYSTTARPPVRWLRGEIRWLAPGQDAVGVLLLPVAGRVVGPFPFVLTRPHG